MRSVAMQRVAVLLVGLLDFIAPDEGGAAMVLERLAVMTPPDAMRVSVSANLSRALANSVCQRARSCASRARELLTLATSSSNAAASLLLMLLLLISRA